MKKGPNMLPLPTIKDDEFIVWKGDLYSKFNKSCILHNGTVYYKRVNQVRINGEVRHASSILTQMLAADVNVKKAREARALNIKLTTTE